MEIRNFFVQTAALIILSILYVEAQRRGDYSDLPPGPYCRARGCCTGRQDECSAPILGTLCYCDDFCNQTRVEDCCPDFWTHCKGISSPPEPTPNYDPQALTLCSYNNVDYRPGVAFKKNCNTCTCEAVGEDAVEQCEQDECLIESEIVNSVNSIRNLGWTASNYSKLWGHKLSEGIELRLGTFHPQKTVMSMNPVRRIYDPSTLPREFSADKKWPSLINGIQDQKWCGASWAISTIDVASDRYGIYSKGLEKVKLSAQNLISCAIKGQQGCKGGHLDRAWAFIRRHGVVNEDCFPYVGYTEKCRIPIKGNLIKSNCNLPFSGRTSKYRVAPAYRLGNETDIMYEMLKSGPVQATMKVHNDFFTYQSGIYKKSNVNPSSLTGYHSVRIVGWGEEYTYAGVQKYWKVANSWGKDWGEDGYFRILKGTNECEIESFVIGTWPEIDKRIVREQLGSFAREFN